MAKAGKRLTAAREKVEAGKNYPVEEALVLVKESATTKFSEV